uniref:Integrase core domain containing protein n=1 Tax=Solanum tuberosum TaxID=4113 RepID=M1DU02_SOLTU
MSGSESTQASGSKSSNASGHASRSESAQVSGSKSTHDAGSGDNEQAASSDEATSSEPVPAPWNDDPILVTGELNRWDSGVPIWHFDRSVHPTGALDIGLIRDEANVAAPRREPQVEVASMAPSSSQSTPQLGATVVPLARVQKLEAQMAELASLRTDVDVIFAAPPVEPEVAPTALADDTVLDALFSGTAEDGLAPTHAKGKRHRSHRTEEEKSQKRQRRQKKEARRASLLDEELRQQRVRERVAGASSSAPVVVVQPILRDVMSTTDGAVRVIESTTDGAMIADVGTTEGAPTIVPVGSGKPDPLFVDDSPTLCATDNGSLSVQTVFVLNENLPS